MTQLVQRQYRKPSSTVATCSGRIIAFISNKGGVGKSTLVTNVACGLAQRHPEQVLLIDDSLQMGVCANLLDLKRTTTLTDAVREQDRLHETLLRRLAASHSCGLHLLEAPANPLESAEIEDHVMARILTIARRAHEFLIVDFFPLLDRVMMAVLDLSDRSYVVLESVVPTVLGVARLLPLLETLGVPNERLRLVLYRYTGSTDKLKPAEVEHRLGRSIEHVLPYHKNVAVASKIGRPYILGAARIWGLGRALARFVDEVETTPRPFARLLHGAKPNHPRTAFLPGRLSTMSAEPPDRSGETSRARDILGKTSLTLPLARAKEKPRLAAASATERTRAKQAPAQQGPAHHLSVQGQLHQRLVDEINARSLLVSSEEVLAGFVREFVERALEEDSLALSETERTQVVEDLLEENVGVGLLAPLMADPAVTDILMNGSDQVYIERFGRLEETTVRFRDAEHLVRIFQRIAARVGRDVDEASPMLDARLPDGSRVNVTLPPVALDGPTLSIRRFGRQRLRREDLLRLICCRRT